MILDRIVQKTLQDLEKTKYEFPLENIENQIPNRKDLPKDMAKILKSNPKSTHYNAICEVKKASPSKGIIKEHFDPINIAKSYESAGACCISVLTEPHFFLGDLQYLNTIDEAVKTPLLRKDFIVDIYQIAQAYIRGADMILLIAKILDPKKFKLLFNYAKDLGLSVLVEVHDEQDLKCIEGVDVMIAGVNHRNLVDFSMDMMLCSKLMPHLKDMVIVAESGIDDQKTLCDLSQQGADAFLIGEYFMRQDNIAGFVRNFLQKPSS